MESGFTQRYFFIDSFEYLAILGLEITHQSLEKSFLYRRATNMSHENLHVHRRTGNIFFLVGGGGTDTILPNFKGRESHERENFEDLEPLDCRKRRFQGLNFTFFGTLVSGVLPYSSDFRLTYAQNLPNFSALNFFGGLLPPPPPPPPRLVRLCQHVI